MSVSSSRFTPTIEHFYQISFYCRCCISILWTTYFYFVWVKLNKTIKYIKDILNIDESLSCLYRKTNSFFTKHFKTFSRQFVEFDKYIQHWRTAFEKLKTIFYFLFEFFITEKILRKFNFESQNRKILFGKSLDIF